MKIKYIDNSLVAVKFYIPIRLYPSEKIEEKYEYLKSILKDFFDSFEIVKDKKPKWIHKCYDVDFKHLPDDTIVLKEPNIEDVKVEKRLEDLIESIKNLKKEKFPLYVIVGNLKCLEELEFFYINYLKHIEPYENVPLFYIPYYHVIVI